MTTIEQIIEIIGTAGVVPDMSKFDPGKTFKENGVDSLDVFTIFLAVEERLGANLSESETATVQSASALVSLLNSRS